ncbi:hypothetical protein Dimus_022736, partial [Dionaea muscipula]
MGGIFKRVQGLYGLTGKKATEEILGGISTTNSEATPEVAMPLQEIRPKGVATSSAQEE